MFTLNRISNKLSTICKLTTSNFHIFTNTKNVRRKSPNITLKAPILAEKERFYCSSEEALSLTNEEIESITDGSEEQIHKLQVILLETEIMRQEGKPVPSQAIMKLDHWKELLNRDSRTGRRKYLEFLFKLEKRKENRIIKKEQKRLEATERSPLIEGAMRYDLGHNNMFLRFYDSTINQLYNRKLINAMQFSQKFVIDCGYHEHMTKRENINCAKQLMLLFSDNRAHEDPFDIHYCNMEKGSLLEDYTHRFIPTMYDAEFPFNVHESSYLDLFPKEKIVYLTPHCREELTEFDHEAVYVIGAIVDKINNEPLSMAKAKKEGLKMAKLPLDQYLLWGSGSGKSLTLNQIVSIMLDMRFKGDWNHALRHVPRRKLVQNEELQEERNQRFSNSWQRSSEGQFRGPQQTLRNRYQTKNSGWRPRSAADDKASEERLAYLKNILQD